MEYVKPESVSILNHGELNEKWVQEHIALDPEILGLGELRLLDVERPQPKAGRLDLLLSDPSSNRRYEVEIQLGPTDESHIIRTIEYWDIERRRYPQLDHCAVIVAEDVTSRFLNVIGLFNGFIPLVAIQMRALSIEDKIALMFTTVLDELPLGLPDDELAQPVDRKYWEQSASPHTMEILDRFMDIVHAVAPGYGPKFNKSYIGMAKDGVARNFVSFYPLKRRLSTHIHLERTDETDARLDQHDLDVMNYDRTWGNYRIRLTEDDIKANTAILTDLTRQAFENYGR